METLWGQGSLIYMMTIKSILHIYCIIAYCLWRTDVTRNLREAIIVLSRVRVKCWKDFLCQGRFPSIFSRNWLVHLFAPHPHTAFNGPFDPQTSTVLYPWWSILLVPPSIIYLPLSRRWSQLYISIIDWHYISVYKSHPSNLIVLWIEIQIKIFLSRIFVWIKTETIFR